MKKITLLVASIFLFGGVVANAADRNQRRSPVDFRNADPIAFTERGIDFYVFADGQFDFNTDADLYNKSNRRNEPNRSYGKHGNGSKWNYGVAVKQDRSGKVRRVGNVIINYDSRNRVSSIGSVDMDYNRYGLTQVGGLHIVYNHHSQIVDVFGDVNNSSRNQVGYYDNNHNDNDYGDNCNMNMQDNNYINNSPRPNKVVASLDIRLNR
ncbi:hypothetical protein [Flavobacterium cellulosilyticum]|uniref:Uncharacterized protein n=1 Tax=Flavobacterium cellulosilyticum TaxID=2541731 RepID=A0A4R5CPG7_9FLAO|nr:hypothetical protein [Flavobacterium cellulosilyticum]TDD99462.1 hypothetical protein E0F76_01685 [Flavobacterium cellulosilyticum]